MARLTERNWLDHGLKTLAKSGYASLKAATMAESLGVSRGSFYWHFKDIRDFQRRLLEHWQRQTTDATIHDMESNEPEDSRLLALMTRAYAMKPNLEKAVRAWAEYDRLAQTQLAKVDGMRLSYIRRLLVTAGLDQVTADHRARFLYAASLGASAIAPAVSPPFTPENLRDLAEMLTHLL